MSTPTPDATSPFTLREWQPAPRAGEDTDVDRSSDDHGTGRHTEGTDVDRQAQIAMSDTAAKRATAVRGLSMDSVSWEHVLAVYFFRLAAGLILPLPVDIGVTEVGTVGAFLAIGVGKSDAVSAVLLLRMFTPGAAQVIALGTSAVLRREVGHVHSATWSLTHQALVAIRLGDYQGATMLLEQVLPAHREQGERHGVGWTLNYLAQIQQLQGGYAQAAALYEESLAVFQELGDKFGISNQLANLASVARDLGPLRAGTAAASQGPPCAPRPDG